MTELEKIQKRRKSMIFTILITLVIVINSAFFIYKYYPIQKDIPEISQNVFEKILKNQDIKEINILKNESIIYLNLNPNSIEKYSKELKLKISNKDPHLQMSVTTVNMFMKNFDKTFNATKLDEKPNINEIEINFPRNYFLPLIYFFEVLIISLLIIFNFIPSFISTKKTFFNQIFVLNLFLGWTIIGWIIALIWSLKNE
ncbi:superinfection immunity protein [Algoriphagus sp.]|uniref:superinfection immunity protein n=1 Tax=Algoriphagus sp. TaxID=1872435 RepID=UPI002727F62C|nr:superinfection immunity protein [Algoriphagus sp.]MDO8965073.1 superinfection immunity protein [Algoriphagus sp.]MDP3199147.1 superinfection immunity protein [Algoriphagus sp.]